MHWNSFWRRYSNILPPQLEQGLRDATTTSQLYGSVDANVSQVSPRFRFQRGTDCSRFASRKNSDSDLRQLIVVPDATRIQSNDD